METKITSRTDNEAKLSIKLDERYLKLALEHVLDELRPQVKAAGFRPGKAPNNVIERELGHSRVQSEVVDHALQHSYSRALRDEKLPVIAPPQVTVEKFVPYTHLEYSVTVQLMPPVKLADYKKFKIKRQEVKVDPAEVDKVIEDLRRREATRF
jgi:trigger factor